MQKGRAVPTPSERLMQIIDDLSAESADALRILDGLKADDWEAPTPAAKWAVRDQVSHLARFDEAAQLAITDPDGFRALADQDLARGPDFPDRIAEDLRPLPAGDLLPWLRKTRMSLLEEFRRTDPHCKLPWYGPPMSPATFAGSPGSGRHPSKGPKSSGDRS
jgi:uncharacterized protein (TIGR03084 family)